MNPFKKLDDFIVDKIYQQIVDLTQKEPRWLVCQMLLATNLINIMDLAFGGQMANVLIGLFCYGLMYVVMLTPAYVSMISIATFQRVLLGVFGVLTIINFLANTTAHTTIVLLRDILYFSAWCFISCRPPKPRVRKTKLVKALA